MALLCFAAGFIAENGNVFIAIGGFWVVMVAVVRGKYAKKSG